METGETHQLLQQDGTNSPIAYSPDGRYVLVSRSHSNVNNQLFLVDTITGDIRTLTPEVNEGQALHVLPAWSADERGLFQGAADELDPNR